MGALMISITIMAVWSKTIYGGSNASYQPRRSSLILEQFTLLAGIAAPREFQNLVTYKVGLTFISSASDARP